MIVIDAGVALRSVLSPDGWAIIAPHEPVAPPLMWSEALSAVRQAVWRGDLATALGREAVGRLDTAPIQRVAPNGILDAAMDVAEALGWAKTYDAEYVALARLLDCPLVTRDGRLQRGARRLVEVLVPTDL